MRSSARSSSRPARRSAPRTCPTTCSRPCPRRRRSRPRPPPSRSLRASGARSRWPCQNRPPWRRPRRGSGSTRPRSGGSASAGASTDRPCEQGLTTRWQLLPAGPMGAVREFILHQFRDCNAAALVDAAKAWEAHLAAGGKMMLTMGGAMSTAELGIVVAELIRRDKVHAMTVTGANLEEDVYNLVGHAHYVRVPGFRELSAADDKALLDRHLNRVTDTCIPEEEAMRKIEHHMLELWADAPRGGTRAFPHEYFYRLLRSGRLENEYQIDPKDSWLAAAAERDLPLFVPGWEDSTLGNMCAAACTRGDNDPRIVKGGVEYMMRLIEWYSETDTTARLGLFQIGGGISGDFPICVV